MRTESSNSLLRSTRNLICATGISLLLGAVSNAQTATNVSAPTAVPPVSNALRLYIVNSEDVPIALAEVVVRKGNRRAKGRTDIAGVLRIEGIEPGEWLTSVRRIGYTETQIDITVAAGENAFTIMVDPISATLKGVDIVERRFMSARLADFEARKSRGEPNAVITREDIERRNPINLSQMFRGMTGLNVTDENGQRYPVASRSMVPIMGAPSACPMRVGVDGLVRPPLSNLDDINPIDVHGVEVYYGPARLPLQLASFRTDNWCGLVMIWTRSR